MGGLCVLSWILSRMQPRIDGVVRKIERRVGDKGRKIDG